MTEPQNPTVSWTKWVSLAIAVAIVSAAVTHLAEINKAFQVSVGKEGNFTIDVRASDNFAEIFKNAVDTYPKLVDTILAGEQYYKVTNASLANALEDLDYSRPDSEEIAKRLRRMLWDLRGPFKVPGALRGADGRMVSALDDLEETRHGAKQASALLAALWTRSLDEEGIFKLPILRATVEIVGGAPSGSRDLKTALACPGSPLVNGRIMNLYVPGQGNIFAEVAQDPSLFDCGGSALTAQELLAEGGRIRLGLSETAFRQLVDPSGASGVGNGRIDANFVVYPRNLVGLQGKEGM